MLKKFYRVGSRLVDRLASPTFQARARSSLIFKARVKPGPKKSRLVPPLAWLTSSIIMCTEEVSISLGNANVILKVVVFGDYLHCSFSEQCCRLAQLNQNLQKNSFKRISGEIAKN